MYSKTPTPLNELLQADPEQLTPELKQQALDDILAEFGSASAADTGASVPEAHASASAPKELVIDGVDFSEFLNDDGASAPQQAAFQAAAASIVIGSAPLENSAVPDEHFSAAQAAPELQTGASQKEVRNTSSSAPADRLVIDGVDFSEFLDDATSEAEASEDGSEASASSAIPPQNTPGPSAGPDDRAPRPQVRRKAAPGGVVLRLFAFAAVLAIVLFLYTQTLQNRVSSADFGDVSRAVLSQLDLEEMQQADAQMVRRLYGFAPSDMDGCVLYYPTSNMGAREVLIVKLSDLSQQQAVADAISTRRQTQMNSFEGYGVEQYALLEQSVTEIQGNYLLFVVHENAEAARQAFLKAL